MSISVFYCCKMVFTHMNIWLIGKKFNETLLPEKEDFYSHLNKDITDTDYTHAKGISKISI